MADSEYPNAPVKLPCAWAFSLGTVQNMVESGALEAWKTSGGHRRIPVASIEKLLARRRNLTPGTQDSGAPLDILIAEDDPTLQLLYQLTMDSLGFADQTAHRRQRF
jgi:excisionase family DNA binding protein